MVVVGMRARGRHSDRRERCRTAVGRHRHLDRVKHQGECPTNPLVLEHRILVVEDHHRQGRIRMGIGEAREPAACRLVLLGEAEHAFRRQIVDHVEIAVDHLDETLVVGRDRPVDHVLRRRLAPFGHAGLVPVFAQLPDVPRPVGVEGLERIGAQADRRVEGKGLDVLFLLEHVLGHDPGRVPAHREQRVEAGVGGLEHEVHGVVVRCVDALDGRRERRAPHHARRRDLGIYGVLDVGGGKVDAVAPFDALLEVHRHFGEVFVVLPRTGGQLVVERPLEARVRIDEPQGVHHQLLQARRPASAVAGGPDVEVRRARGRILRVVDDQRFVARQISDWRRGSILREHRRHHTNGRNQD